MNLHYKSDGKIYSFCFVWFYKNQKVVLCLIEKELLTNAFRKEVISFSFFLSCDAANLNSYVLEIFFGSFQLKLLKKFAFFLVKFSIAKKLLLAYISYYISRLFICHLSDINFHFTFCFRSLAYEEINFCNYLTM